MARADLVVNLVKSVKKGDQMMFTRTLEAMIAEERTKQHHVLAERLSDFLQNGSATNGSLNGKNNLFNLQIDKSNFELQHGLLSETNPVKKITDLFLTGDTLESLSEFIEEQHRGDLLRGHNIEPRNRILLEGPPGNGKTSLAEAIANSLILPFIVVRYEGIIGSYLGETSARLKKVIDYARTRHCILFFDEFETIGKERGDLHETGEIKRVVSSLLMQIDDLPSHVVVIVATNHPELLDRAVWRRFQMRLTLPQPSISDIKNWLSNFFKDHNFEGIISLDDLSKKLSGFSYSEIEDFGLNVKRRLILEEPNDNFDNILAKQLKTYSSKLYKKSD